MNALLFLIGAVVVAALAIAALTYRQRRPKSMEAGMREFERGLRALDPNTDPRRRGGNGAGGNGAGGNGADGNGVPAPPGGSGARGPGRGRDGRSG